MFEPRSDVLEIKQWVSFFLLKTGRTSFIKHDRLNQVWVSTKKSDYISFIKELLHTLKEQSNISLQSLVLCVHQSPNQQHKQQQQLSTSLTSESEGEHHTQDSKVMVMDLCRDSWSLSVGRASNFRWPRD